MVVSKDKNHAVLVYFQALNLISLSPKIKIPGLDDNKTYRVEEFGLTLPGSVLRNLGLVLPRSKQDFASFLININAVD